MTADAPYASLTPDLVLDAVSACGLWPDGRLLALNSYENRVWQVGLEDAPPVIAKFYRPGRWSDAAIIEEHAFAQELAEAELPVVAPLAFDGRTLLQIPSTASEAATIDPNDATSVARSACAGISRRIARVTIPSVPSLPTNSFSSDSPATSLNRFPPSRTSVPSASTTSRPST